MGYKTDEEVQARLQEHLNYFNKDIGEEFFGIFIYGSWNLGLEYEDSDVDSYIVFLPSDGANNCAKTFSFKNNEKIIAIPLSTFYRNLKEQQIMVLQLLFSKFYIINPKYLELWNFLLNNREGIAKLNSEKIKKSILERLNTTKNLYFNPTPEYSYLYEARGYDTKRPYCMYYLYLLSKKLSTGTPYGEALDLSQFRQELINIKRGNISEEEATSLLLTSYEKAIQEIKNIPNSQTDLKLERELFIRLCMLQY